MAISASDRTMHIWSFALIWMTVMLDTSLSNPDPRFCPVNNTGGWDYRDSCYHIVEEKMSWEEAEHYCQDIYEGHLLEILNHSSQMFINYVLSDQRVDFWIGIQIKNQSSQRWSSGWHVEFAEWGDEHKNFSDGTCALMMPKGNWSAAPCDTKHPFICESPEDSPPVLKKAPDGWICPTTSNDWVDLGGDTCYIFETVMRLRWFQANLYCNKKGGSLASIHSDTETKILKPLLTRKEEDMERILIGLHTSLHNSSIYEWADGSEFDYENWSRGEPTYYNHGRQCGSLFTPYMGWHVFPCDADFLDDVEFLCSAKKVPPNPNQDNQTQSQTTVPAPRNSSNEVSEINREISLKTIGISVLILVLSCFIGITIGYYMKLYIPGFRSKKKATSTEELNPVAVKFSKL